MISTSIERKIEQPQDHVFPNTLKEHTRNVYLEIDIPRVQGADAVCQAQCWQITKISFDDAALIPVTLERKRVLNLLNKDIIGRIY